MFEAMVAHFRAGAAVEVSDALASAEYATLAGKIKGLADAVKKLEVDQSPGLVASGVEFILEGLHLNKRLNKDKIAGKVQYRG